MITFQVKRHTHDQERHCVEICDDGELIAVVYAQSNKVKIVSKYLDGRSNFNATYPQAVEVSLERGGRGHA